jgi:hypothetical protein
VCRPLAPRGVRHDDRETGGGLHLRLVEERLAVLRERTAVHVEQHRVAPAGLEARRAHDPGVDLVGAVGARHAEALPVAPVARHVRQLRADGVVGCDGVELRWVPDRRRGVRDATGGGVEAVHRERSLRDGLGRPAVQVHPVQVRLAPVLCRGEQGPVVEPHGCVRARRRLEGAIERAADPAVLAAVEPDDPDPHVLRVDLAVVVAEEGHDAAVRRHPR